MRLSRACYSNINNQGKRSDSFRRSHLKKFQLLSDQVAQLCFSNNDAEEMNAERYMRAKLAFFLAQLLHRSKVKKTVTF